MQLENFTHVFYRSLIRRLSLRTRLQVGIQDRNSLRLRHTHQAGCESIQNTWQNSNASLFRLFIYFLSYTRSLKCGQFTRLKNLSGCVCENSYWFSIFVDGQTEGDVIILHKTSPSNRCCRSPFTFC